MTKQILFVDDEQPVLDALRRMLRPQRNNWEMVFVNRPEAACKLLSARGFDAVVSDVEMPGMNGLQLLQHIKQAEHTRDIPVVILTGLDGRELKRQALDLGATDLLNKPVDPEDLRARLHSVLRLKSYQDELKTYNDRLERTVEKRTQELRQSRLDVIWRLASAAEHRDRDDTNHVIRVGCMSRVVAESLGMSRSFVETLFLAAPLHDIGKIGIPDAILVKRGTLSPGEWETMKQHCLIGQRILREDSSVRAAFLQWQGRSSLAETDISPCPFLQTAATVALTHHEKWDGTGYPQELAGEDIPLESRIAAIADVFDAVTSRRAYKAPFAEDEALRIIREGRGAHFDPAVHDAFMDALPEIRSIRVQFADSVKFSTESEEICHAEDLVCR